VLWTVDLLEGRTNMGLSRKRVRLSLEHLESRVCPTLNVIFTGGNLFILGRPAPIPINTVTDGLNIQVTSSTGAVTVTEVENGATVANFGTYIVRKNLYLGLTDYDTDINVDLNGQRLFANVTMNLGLGDHTPFGALITSTPNPINIYDSTNSGTASVAGNITVLKGSGIELLSIGANALLPPSTNGIEVDGDVNVHMPNRIDNSGLTTGDNLFISGTSDIRGDVNTTGVDNVTVGESVSNDSTTIRGNLNVTNAGALNEVVTQVYGTVGGNISMHGSAATGAFLPDELILGSGITPTTVGGNVTLDLTAFQNDEFDVAAGSTIEGNVAYTGVGASAVNMNGSVFGDTVLTMSDAANLVTMGPSASFNGDLHILAGHGNNTIALAPTIGGNLRLDLGNGDNLVTFLGTMDGGTLTSNTGNGDNTITLGGTGPYGLVAHLGSGANTMSFDADQTGSTDIEFAPHVGAVDTLNQSGTIHGPFKLVNYP
jgi:hypothetical protein